MEISQMQEKLKGMLCERRYIHSIGVMEAAVHMAGIFGVEPEKARIAGLLHDCAKNIDKDKMPILCEELGVYLDQVKLKQRSLIHADLGAKLAETEFGITDPDILDAIRYHTLGRPHMTRLEEILYIADFTEPNRKSFPGLSTLRELAEVDLDLAMLRAVESSISYVESQGKIVHEQSVLTREYYSKLIAEREKEKVIK